MSKMEFTSLFIEALDVWLFRDGRPFDASSYHRAESMFPPYPTVIQGALRTFELLRRGVDLNDSQAKSDAVGTADELLNLKLRGPFVAKRDGEMIVRYFPQPADAFSIPDFDPGKPRRIRPASPPQKLPAGMRTNLPEAVSQHLGLQDPLLKGDSHLWVTEENLIRYLSGEAVESVRAETLFVKDPRIGIGIESNRKTTRDGALYEVEFIQPEKGVGVLVEMQGYSDWPDCGVLRLGGESRGAFFSQQPQLAPLPQFTQELRRPFKVYFATPACFSAGWLPENWDKYFDGKVELEAVATTGFESVGGFDYARQQHKPARRYIPAGSVYYFMPKSSVFIKPSVFETGMTEEGAGMGFGQIILEEYEHV
jgi:CRISPR-associated protein Cmr3